MKRTYDLGESNEMISVSVDLGTQGIAYTAVTLNKSGGQIKTIVNTHDLNTVDIPKTNIENSSAVKNSYVVITTLVDLSHLSSDNIESAINIFYIKYAFFGGKFGKQEYNADTDDKKKIVINGKVYLSIVKPINLI